MKALWTDFKWLFNFITSVIMYAIIVIFIIVGIIMLVYFIDFKIRADRIEAPLYGAYVIVSGSMEPIIKVKDAVIVRRMKDDNLKIGDVVTYRSIDEAYYGILITHRIVDIKEENGKKMYVTKGDHNPTNDRSMVEFGQIYGKVVMRIPKIGHLKYFLVNSYGWILAVVIPSLAIIIYDIIKFIKNIKNDTYRKESYRGKKILDFEE